MILSGDTQIANHLNSTLETGEAEREGERWGQGLKYTYTLDGG